MPFDVGFVAVVLLFFSIGSNITLLFWVSKRNTLVERGRITYFKKSVWSCALGYLTIFGWLSTFFLLNYYKSWYLFNIVLMGIPSSLLMEPAQITYGLLTVFTYTFFDFTQSGWLTSVLFVVIGFAAAGIASVVCNFYLEIARDKDREKKAKSKGRNRKK